MNDIVSGHIVILNKKHDNMSIFWIRMKFVIIFAL
jgi:hypothetical protein